MCRLREAPLRRIRHTSPGARRTAATGTWNDGGHPYRRPCIADAVRRRCAGRVRRRSLRLVQGFDLGRQLLCCCLGDGAGFVAMLGGQLQRVVWTEYITHGVRKAASCERRR